MTNGLRAASSRRRAGTDEFGALRNGETIVLDGPFAETKEQLAGFYLVDANDLNDALRIAAKIPPAKTGASRCDRCANCRPADNARREPHCHALPAVAGQGPPPRP